MSRRPNLLLRQAWRERLLRFQQRPTTVTRFCEAEQVSNASFYAWRRRLAEECAGGEDKATFLAVNLPMQTTTAAADVRVQLPGGATLELREGWSQERLQQVIAATLQATTAQAAAERIDNPTLTGGKPIGSRRRAC